MVVSRLRQGKPEELIAEKAIPPNSFIDFDCPSTRAPDALFEGGKVMASCSATGDSRFYAHKIGDYNQFAHLQSIAGDGTEEDEDNQTQGS